MVHFSRIELVSIAPFLVSIVVLLSILNWSLEGAKWNFLIRLIHYLSLKKIIASIFFGLAANIVAPNRTGELAARLKYIPKKKRINALYLNFFSASSQLYITILAGLVSAFYLSSSVLSTFELNSNYFLIGLCTFTLLSGWLFVKSTILARIFAYFNRSKIAASSDFVEVRIRDRVKVFAYSSIRYLVFCLQFFLILKSLGADISFVDSTSRLALIFLVNSIIPSNWITELITKGSVTFFVFQLTALDPMIPLVAITSLWFINIFIPSLLGIYFLKDINWIGKLKFRNH